MTLTYQDVDIIELEAVEEEGVVRSLTRKFLVTGLNNTNTDNRTLDEALSDSNVPSSGDAAPGNTNLVCHRRTVRPVQDSPTKCYVICEYKTVADWANSFVFSGGSQTSQIQTDVDFYGNRIALSYTYPNDYPVTELRGEVYTTSINETVNQTFTTLTATGSLFVTYPNEISETWSNTVNSTFWAGAPAYYWRCSDCQFSGRDIGFGRPHLWEFTWTFEKNPQSWAVVAKIIDPNTGRVPDDVIQGTGVKTVDWYRTLDFNIIFGNT